MITEEQIEKIIEELNALAEKAMNVVDGINIDDIDMNPFLLRIMGLSGAEEIAAFIVNQRAERSIVTTFGNRIQKIATIFSEGTGVAGADICKTRDNRRYYIQIKSGPKTVNRDITAEISKLLDSARRRNQGSVGLIGMTYGKKERVSGVLRRYSTVDWKIGREFWAFISEEPDCAKIIFDLAGKVISETKKASGGNFQKRKLEKIKELAKHIEDKYGKGDIMWDNLFDDNM